MGRVFAPDRRDQGDDCPTCGYTPTKRDRYPIIEYGVVHVRCYQCGEEWVE
jgi:predicted RNA-binding Zn-ribbon protein involved in translation (DUF1610 family)